MHDINSTSFTKLIQFFLLSSRLYDRLPLRIPSILKKKKISSHQRNHQFSSSLDPEIVAPRKVSLDILPLLRAIALGKKYPHKSHSTHKFTMDPEIGGSNGHEELSGIATTRARFRGVRTRERERRARDDRMLPAEKESLVPGPIARQHVATSRQAARPSFAHHTCATLPTPSETIDFNERRNNRFSIRVYSRIFSPVFERLFVFVFS